MKLRVISLLSLTVSIFLVGCAPVYQEPTQDPAAYLSFAQSNEIRHSVVITFADGTTCKGPRMLTSLAHKNQTIKIPAEKEMAFNIDWYEGADSCFLFFSFFPKTNQKYVLDFEIVSPNCEARVSKVSDQEVTPIPVHKRTPNIWAIGPNAPACEPLK